MFKGPMWKWLKVEIFLLKDRKVFKILKPICVMKINQKPPFLSTLVISHSAFGIWSCKRLWVFKRIVFLHKQTSGQTALYLQPQSVSLSPSPTLISSVMRGSNCPRKHLSLNGATHVQLWGWNYSWICFFQNGFCKPSLSPTPNLKLIPLLSFCENK